MKIVIDLGLEFIGDEDNLEEALKSIVLEELRKAIAQMIYTDDVIKLTMDQIKRETVPLIIERLRRAQARVIE